jgi:hypothetical protein
VEADEIAAGLWRWIAPHPNWRNWPDWPDTPEEVGCIYYEAADAVALIDPLLPRGEEAEFLAHLDRDVKRAGLRVMILLTADWHRRSTDELTGRYGAEVNPTPLPEGVEEIAIAGANERQVAFFIRPHRALVVAEILMGDGKGGLRLCPSPALRDRAALDASLDQLLALPVERVLVSHGEPVVSDGRRAMERAVAGAR